MKNILDLLNEKDEEKVQLELSKASNEIYEAIAHSIMDSPFPRKVIAARWGIHESLISKILNPYDPANLHVHKLPQFLYGVGEPAKRVIHLLAGLVGGFFVENPDISNCEGSFEDFSRTLKAFSLYIESIAEAEEDGIITKAEAKKIRLNWERVKRLGEAFVKAIEK